MKTLLLLQNGEAKTAFQLVEIVQNSFLNGLHFCSLKLSAENTGLIVSPTDDYDPKPASIPNNHGDSTYLFLPKKEHLRRFEHLLVAIRHCFPGISFQLIEISINSKVLFIRKTVV